MAFRRQSRRSRRSFSSNRRSRRTGRQRSAGRRRGGSRGQTVRVVLEHVQSNPAATIPVGYTVAQPGQKSRF